MPPVAMPTDAVVAVAAATPAPNPATNNAALAATNALPPPPPPPPVVWPDLIYRGMFIANGETQAIFNSDLILEIGAQSGAGVTLLSVEEKSARVRYQTEERAYRRGGGIIATNRP
jgi:hypothetical protein